TGLPRRPRERLAGPRERTRAERASDRGPGAAIRFHPTAGPREGELARLPRAGTREAPRGLNKAGRRFRSAGLRGDRPCKGHRGAEGRDRREARADREAPRRPEGEPRCADWSDPRTHGTGEETRRRGRELRRRPRENRGRREATPRAGETVARPRTGDEVDARDSRRGLPRRRETGPRGLGVARGTEASTHSIQPGP